MAQTGLRRRLGCALALFILAGCGQDVQPIAQPDSVEIEFAEALTATAEANAKVAEVEKGLARLPTKRLAPATADTPPAPAPARRDPSLPVRIDWNGPVEPLLHSLARLTGHSLTIAGKPPINPLQVAVTGFSGHPLDAIAEIDTAAFGAATITVDHAGRTITLAYAD